VRELHRPAMAPYLWTGDGAALAFPSLDEPGAATIVDPAYRAPAARDAFELAFRTF
jgi:hypothetical protein